MAEPQLSLPEPEPTPVELTAAPPDLAVVPATGYDVAVVGAGLAGLAVGSLIARAGRSVVVLERGATPGGIGAVLPGENPPVDAGVLPITDAGSDGALKQLCERLGMAWSPDRVDPILQIALPHHRLTLSQDMAEWWPELRREMPEDEPIWRTLFPTLIDLAHDRDALARSLPPLPAESWWARLQVQKTLAIRCIAPKSRDLAGRIRYAARTPFRETLSTAGLGPVSEQALAACLWYLALRSVDECSTLEAALALRPLTQGWAAASGSLPTLAKRLLERLASDGGEVRYGVDVVALDVEKGKVRGLRTADGDCIPVRWVVADVGPDVLTGLVPARPRWAAKGSLARRFAPRAVAQIMTLVVPEAFLSAELGTLCLVVPQAGTPATEGNVVFVRSGEGPAASDRHITIGRFVPPDHAQSDPSGPLLRAAEQILPGIGAAAVRQTAYTCDDLAKIWGRPKAGLCYTESGRDWLGRRGAPHRLGWPGLLAVGDWTYPGRLPTDVIAGALETADLILAEW